MKICLFLPVILSLSSLASAQSGIATMFSCDTQPESDGEYYSFAISTRDFEKLNVEIHQLNDKKADRYLEPESNLVATLAATKTYAGGRKLHGYQVNSKTMGPVKIFFALNEFEAYAADTTGRVQLKTTGQLDNERTSEIIRCRK